MAEKPEKKHPGRIDPEIEAEVAAMLSDDSLDDMLMSLGGAPMRHDDAEQSVIQPDVDVNVGEKARGRVVIVSDDSILLEFGPRQQGAVPREQYGEEMPKPGDIVEVNVQRFDKGEGLLVCNRVGAVQKAEWENLEEGQVVQARCTGTNKGGLEMEVAGHRAFMPAGQVSLWHVDNLDEMINEQITCEVIEFNKDKRNIVLSRRAVMQREREEQKKKLEESLEVGQVHEGTVRKIMPFGAFVDLGGVDGLVHVSDLSYERVRDPGEVVKEGQRVKVQILKLDLENDRVSLGMKQLQDDPFELTAEKLNEGDTVSGRVTRLANFGAFVEIQPGVEGLIHISELSHDRVGRVSQVVKENEIVQVQILNIDPESRRISLSLKALQEKKQEEEGRPDDAALEKLKAKFGAGRKLKGGLE